MLVDSHCHLNFPDFKDDIEAVIARAHDAGVHVMQTICTEMAEFEEVVSIASSHEGIFCSLGVHPNDSGKTDVVTLETLLEKATHPKVIGIGETGLDYHYETSERTTQQQSFRVHIAAVQKLKLPLIVHTRDAEEDTISILCEEMQKGHFTGVIHCFTSSAWLAQKALELGFYISLSGILTFKNAASIRDAVKDMPLERLLIETDSPFLAPLPYRGKRNEPSYVVEVCKQLALIKGISMEECMNSTTKNFFTLFNKAKLP